jgi:hypothetical protein
MRKIFLLLIVFLSGFYGCSEEINLPEPEIKTQEQKIDNNLDTTTLSILKLGAIQFYNRDGIKIGAINGLVGENPEYINLYGNIRMWGREFNADYGYFPISLAVGIKQYFKINEAGQITELNGIEASKSKLSIITSDGLSFTPKRMAMWRGELFEDPEDGISGDRYYNITTNKEKVFIKSKNKWVNSN